VKLKLPDNVVKLLIYWYSNQLMNARWKHIQSGSFIMKKWYTTGKCFMALFVHVIHALCYEIC